eukprot:TRINITY_DN3371_c0_g1_i1.p2 TRINITY_DN3371_c0_g1~~TRINITY_DN3371_c0_g1_i1.p2  ORF type:complete len:149 (+),score=35.76 TRINITY_DN3371_c0_g1_i1:71-517(+)
MKVLLMMLCLFACVEAKNQDAAGTYCTKFDVLVLQETIELTVYHISKKFDFKASGAMTIPACNGNKYIKHETEESGDYVASPDMNQPNACLLHELRHLGTAAIEEPPVSILWHKETDSISVRITDVPIIGEVSFTLTKEACKVIDEEL